MRFSTIRNRGRDDVRGRELNPGSPRSPWRLSDALLARLDLDVILALDDAGALTESTIIQADEDAGRSRREVRLHT
jgi:hypothetical protein